MAETINIKYPIINTFSFPILSARTPDGMPIIVWDMLITAYTSGMTSFPIPKSDAFSKMKE